MIVPTERDQIPPRDVGLSKLLIVEGETPLHFFEALAVNLGLNEEIEIRDYGGITKLGRFLKTIASTSAFRTNVTSLGIARDAENDAAAAAQSVNSAIEGAGLSEEVRIRVAILPDNDTPGMIETLCLRSVASDPIMGCVDSYLDCVQDNGVKLPGGIALDKHRAWVFLSGKGLPEKPVGIAAYKNAWPFDNSAFDSLKKFLQSL
jgi:hypothetical protein